MTDEFVFVTDLTPTLLSLPGVDDHSRSWNGTTREQITGKDFSDFLSGDSDHIHIDSTAIGYELGGNRALFKGDYKIVFNRSASNDQAWHLFNIKTDPGERNDLSTTETERFAEMLSDYEEYARTNNVLPMPEGYDQMREIFRGVLH